jgi:hypothetical protein
MAKVIGNIVGVPNPKSDWNQNDATKADYIKNKPDVYTKKEVDKKLSDIQVSGGGGNSEPFVITFATRVEVTDTGYVEHIFGDKTFDEVKEALEQGKKFVGCDLWGLRVDFTVVPDIEVSNVENAISLTALTGNLLTVSCTCWKDLYPENNGWTVEQNSVITIVNNAIRLGILDSWEVAV